MFDSSGLYLGALRRSGLRARLASASPPARRARHGSGMEQKSPAVQLFLSFDDPLSWLLCLPARSHQRLILQLLSYRTDCHHSDARPPTFKRREQQNPTIILAATATCDIGSARHQEAENYRTRGPGTGTTAACRNRLISGTLRRRTALILPGCLRGFLCSVRRNTRKEVYLRHGPSLLSATG